ncbi:hypothetical protein FHL15_010780 [Xylaria flabelliformis]|uniref:2EXR domain-containing protein n=1 Tax=Xylaria flabelliformis TaxID=2512241 RepID=A0A553HK65_9PEZI|nr:hypothetical protein FHL15_010780 [Xylaria flabelliformis]
MFFHEIYLPQYLQFAEYVPSPVSTACFPQFPRLPTEIRIAIWGQFALPKKLQHIVRQGSNCITEVILSNPAGSRKRMDIRRIMQVNAEARHEVLQGHQLVVWDKTRDLQGRPRPTSSFSFVNWELDLFSVRSRNGYEKRFTKEPYNRIKNLAVGIVGSFGPTSPFLLAPYGYEFGSESREAFGSVQRVVFIVGCCNVWQGLFICPRELSEDIIGDYPEYNGVFRDGRDLLMNEYGMHTVVDPTDHIYDGCKARIVTEIHEGSPPTVVFKELSFSQWVEKALPALIHTSTHGKPWVECQIMLDYLGHREQNEIWRNSQLDQQPI